MYLIITFENLCKIKFYGFNNSISIKTPIRSGPGRPLDLRSQTTTNNNNIYIHHQAFMFMEDQSHPNVAPPE